MTGIYRCPLFNGLTIDEIDGLLAGRESRKTYESGEIIAAAGDRNKGLLIVESGSINGEMTNYAGDRIIIEHIPAPRAIAPAFLYATDNLLPVDVIAAEYTCIVSIDTDLFTEILQANTLVLRNFLRNISDRGKFLSDRVRLLRFGTIKSKLAGYLLEQLQKQQKSEFEIPHTQLQLADMFGVTRPALSRALSQIADTEIICFRRNHFQILDESRLIRLYRE